jgi:hypothetical protein
MGAMPFTGYDFVTMFSLSRVSPLPTHNPRTFKQKPNKNQSTPNTLHPFVQLSATSLAS